MAMRCDILSDTRAAARTRADDAPSLHVYIQLSDAPYAYGQVLDRDRVVDYAADGTPIGVEFLDVSGCVGLSDVPHADQVARALQSYNIAVCP